jgi:hypothetical protein
MGTTGVAAYLLNPKVAYATAPGTWSKIGNQLWLAMYNRGFEAWTAWRTYDMPGFNTCCIWTTSSYKIYILLNKT